MLWPECKHSTPGSIPPSNLSWPLPVCHDAETAVAQLTWLRKCVAWGRLLAPAWLLFFFALKQDHLHTQTHFCLIATTYVWLQTPPAPLPAVHNHSLNYFLKNFIVPPPTSHTHNHSLPLLYTHPRHSNTFVSVSESGQCFILLSLFLSSLMPKKVIRSQFIWKSTCTIVVSPAFFLMKRICTHMSSNWLD